MTIIQPEVLELERIHSLEPPETSTETLLRWSGDDLFRVQMENLFLRKMIRDGEQERTGMRFSRNHWRMASAVGFGLAVIAAVCR